MTELIVKWQDKQGSSKDMEGGGALFGWLWSVLLFYVLSIFLASADLILAFSIISYISKLPNVLKRKNHSQFGAEEFLLLRTGADTK